MTWKIDRRAPPPAWTRTIVSIDLFIVCTHQRAHPCFVPPEPACLDTRSSSGLHFTVAIQNQHGVQEKTQNSTTGSARYSALPMSANTVTHRLGWDRLG